MADSNPIQIAEVRLLRNIWTNPNILDDQEYNEDVFFHPFCRTIANAIDTLTKNGTPLSTQTLYMEAAQNDSSITQDVIKDITENNSETGEYVKDITDYLKSARKATDAIDRLDHVKEIIVNNPKLSTDMLQDIRDSLYSAEDGLLSTDKNSVKRIMKLSEWGDQWEEDFKLRKNGRRYYFNEPIFDKLVTDGPIPGAGTLVVAASGMGKSTMVLKLVNGFINASIPCIFFSLEMGSISTYDRLLANRLQIPYSEFVNPSDEETFQSIYEQVRQERQTLDQNNLFRFCEDANISLADIKKAIIKFQEQIGQQYCIVVLDLVTMVQDFVKNRNGLGMAQQMEVAVNALNALAKELGIHYIGTAQMNRSSEQSSVTDPDDVLRFRPTRAGIKNSGALLERARVTISLFRKKYYLQQYFQDDEELLESEPDLVELSVLKQNNGQCLRLYESFEGSTFTMLPVDIESQSDEDDE